MAPTKRRKRAKSRSDAPEALVSSTSISSCPDTVSSSSCLILNLPPEILEMLLGNVSILDLENFIDSSPLIKLCFSRSRYGALHRLIYKHEKGVFLKIFERMEEQPLVHWRTHDVLRAFTDATCDYIIDTSSPAKRCSETAPHISWLSAPLQRLCDLCYRKYENEDFFLLTRLLKHYKLKDGTGIPTHTVESCTGWRSGTVVASRKQVERVAKSKYGTRCPPSIGPSTKALRSSGISKTVLILDPMKKEALSYISCRWCVGTEFPTPAHATAVFPSSYDCLRNHLELCHPEMLDAFDEGWKGIGEGGRTTWLNQVKTDPYATRPSDFYASPDFGRHPHQFRPYMFTSWPTALEDACRDLMTPLRYSRIDKTVQVREAVESVLSRSKAAIFHLPPMPNAETEGSYREALRRVRSTVASRVAATITEVEMKKVFESIQNRLAEKGGLESILEEYTPQLNWLKDKSVGQNKVAEDSGSVEL